MMIWTDFLPEIVRKYRSSKSQRAFMFDVFCRAVLGRPKKKKDGDEARKAARACKILKVSF